MLSENELDNILVRQKDQILNLVNKRRFSEAVTTLNTVKELWDEMNYTYKYDEIMKRIKQ